MPFIPDPQFQTNTGFQPQPPAASGFIPDTSQPQSQNIFQTIGKSSLNPVRDVVAGATGQLLKLSPSFRGAEQARVQAQQVQDIASKKGVQPPPVGESTQDILSQAGAAPSAGQVAGSALSTASMFIPGGGKILEVLGKDAVQGFSMAYGSALQDKQDQTSAAKQGAYGALFNVGLGLLGKGASALWKGLTSTLPERLVSPTFRQTGEDILSQARSEVQGKPTKTLARQALEAGVSPGGASQVVSVIKELNNTENQLRSVVSGAGKSVDIGDREPYIKFLQQVKQSYEGGFMSNTAKQADTFIKQLKTARFGGGKGDITAETALDLKRFIDKMRNTSSFRLDPNLLPKQEQYKAGADLLRNKLRSAIPKAADLLDKEQQYIKFADAIAQEAARRGNGQVFNLFDAIVGGESMGAGFPFSGIGLDAALRTAQQPSIRGKIAQGLFKTGQVAGSTPPIVGATAAPLARFGKSEVSSSLSQPQ